MWWLYNLWMDYHYHNLFILSIYTFLYLAADRINSREYLFICKKNRYIATANDLSAHSAWHEC